MSLVDLELDSTRLWGRVGDFFEVTRKPRGLPALADDTVPFAPMDAVPLNHFRDPVYETRPWTGRGTGTYFERGDILVARITPSFENGKQATTDQLPTPFGFATTEVIPLRPISPDTTDKRLLFFYLLHPRGPALPRRPDGGIDWETTRFRACAPRPDLSPLRHRRTATHR